MANKYYIQGLKDMYTIFSTLISDDNNGLFDLQRYSKLIPVVFKEEKNIDLEVKP